MVTTPLLPQHTLQIFKVRNAPKQSFDVCPGSLRVLSLSVLAFPLLGFQAQVFTLYHPVSVCGTLRP
jgi:hypothetical protein